MCAQVLELVDREDDARSPVTRGLAAGDEQIGDVLRKIARVGDASQSLHVDGDPCSVGELERERLEDSQRPCDRRRDDIGAEWKENSAEPARQQCREVSVLRRLDEPDPEALLLRDLRVPIEEDRFAGPAEPDQQQALARLARHGTAEGDAESVDQLVATGERGWWRSSARPVWIGQLVHRFNRSYAVL